MGRRAGSRQAAVSPDSRTLATARSEAAEGRTRGRVELRDAATGKSLRQTPDQPHALSGMVCSPDSKWLLQRGVPGPEQQLWDVATLRDFPPPLPVRGFSHQPGRLQPRRPDPAAGLPGWSRPGCGMWTGTWRSIPEHGPSHGYPIASRLRPDPLEGGDGLWRAAPCGSGTRPGVRCSTNCGRMPERSSSWPSAPTGSCS